MLCQATNALARGDLDAVPHLIASSREVGRRLRTFASQGSTLAQEAVLMLELDRREELVAIARPHAAQSPANVWHGILALCGTLESPLIDLAPLVPTDDLFAVFTALAAEVAARAGDVSLGTWCLRHLEPRGASTIMSGLGTLVFGSARHFTGLARVAVGDLDGAAADFEQARSMATANRAHLWGAHSTIELADALRRRGRPDDERAAFCLVDRCLDARSARSPRLERRCREVSAMLVRRVVADEIAGRRS
jgi:hypothetical protein